MTLSDTPRKKCLDRTFQDITHPDDLQADLDYMKQLLDGKLQYLSHGKTVYIGKMENIIWVNLTCVPLWFEKTDPRLHIAIVEDITERIRTRRGPAGT